MKIFYKFLIHNNKKIGLIIIKVLLSYKVMNELQYYLNVIKIKLFLFY